MEKLMTKKELAEKLDAIYEDLKQVREKSPVGVDHLRMALNHIAKVYNMAVEVSKPDGEATNVGVKGIVTSE